MIIHYPQQAALEVSHSFREKSNFFTSYLVRTLLALVVPAVLLAFLSLSAKPIIEQVNGSVMPCTVHGYKYECAGIATDFYMYAMICGRSCVCCVNALLKWHLIHISLSGVICLASYLLCNIYNFLWLVIPPMGKFSRIMSKFKGTGNSDDMDELNRVYYNNRDFRLLLNLLWVVQNQIT